MFKKERNQNKKKMTSESVLIAAIAGANEINARQREDAKNSRSEVLGGTKSTAPPVCLVVKSGECSLKASTLPRT